LFEELQDVKRTMSGILTNVASLSVYSKNYQKEIEALKSNLSGLECTVKSNEDELKDIDREQKECLEMHKEEATDKKEIAKVERGRWGDFKFVALGIFITIALEAVLRFLGL